MADLSLRYLLYGEDKTASKSLKGVGAQAQTTAGAVGSAVGRLGQVVGGEVGQMLDRVSMGLDQVGVRSSGMAPKLIAGGSAMLGLGVAMSMMASKDVESMKQLDAAVEATGMGYDAFGSDVQKLIDKQVAFGNSDDQVTTALRVLTQAYGDPKKALAEMSLTTDLAAAKHIDLAAAAGMVAKAHGGAGRVFKEFGLTVGFTAAGTKDYDGALTVLSGKLAGQASASMDSFGGKVRQVRTWIENQATALSEKYGPAVTVTGGAVTALGSVMQVTATRTVAATVATQAGTVAQKSSTIAMAASAVAARGLAIASGPVGLALVVLTTIAGAFVKSQMDSKQRSDDLRASLDQTTGAITDQTKQLVALQLQQDGTFKLGLQLGVSQKTLTDAALGDAAALKTLTDRYAAQNAVGLTAIKTGGLHADQYGRLASSTDVFSSATDQATAKSASQAAGFRTLLGAVTPINSLIKGQSTDQKELAAATTNTVNPIAAAAQAQKDLAAKTKDAADKVKAASDKIRDYHQALVDAGLVILSTRDAQRALIQSQVDATKAVHENGRGLSLNTQKGRDNAAALDTMAKNAIALGTATYASTHSEAAMRASLVTSRAALVKTYLQFDNNIGRANAYANSVLKIPPAKKTTVTAVTAAAAAKITALQRQITAIKQGKVPGIDANTKAGKAKIAALNAQIDALNRRRAVINVNTHSYSTGPGGSGGPVAGRAVGGPALAGMPYIVGDGGRPELFVPDTNGTILPRVPTLGGGSSVRGSSAGGTRGGDTFNLYVNGQVYGSAKDLAKAVLPGLQQLRGQGVRLGLA